VQLRIPFGDGVLVDGSLDAIGGQDDRQAGAVRASRTRERRLELEPGSFGLGRLHAGKPDGERQVARAGKEHR